MCPTVEDIKAATYILLFTITDQSMKTIIIPLKGDKSDKIEQTRHFVQIDKFHNNVIKEKDVNGKLVDKVKKMYLIIWL